MKTRQILLSVPIICIGLLLPFSSCKKSRTTDETAIASPKTDDRSQASSDSRLVIAENDASVDDINQTLSNNTSMHGRLSSVNKTTTPACDFTVDTIGAYLGTIKLNYNGAATCGVRKRQGSVKLTILDYATGKRWKDAGCVLKVEYMSFKVTNLLNNESVELNGIQNLTNVSGGTWFDLVVLGKPNLVNSVSGTNLSVKFNGTANAVYNINRKFTYTWATLVLTCTGEGIGSSGNLTNLENYGTTRDGDPFTSEVKIPIVWNSTCGWGSPLSGRLNIKVPTKSFDLDCLFGVDDSGNANTAVCAYGWKLTWTVGSNTDNTVIKY